MKQAMSAFDLRAIAHELGASWRVGQEIYMPTEQVVLASTRRTRTPLTSSSSRQAHFDVHARPPDADVATAVRDALAKQLGNARLIAVEQLAFDRLLRMTFTTKGGDRHPSSNASGTATSSCSTRTTPSSSPDPRHLPRQDAQAWRSLPSTTPALDPDALDEAGLAAVLSASERNLASTLGGQVNLGGRLANAVCDAAGLDADMAANEADAGTVHGPARAVGRVGARTRTRLKADAPDVHDGSLDAFLMEHVEEATPVLLPDHAGRNTMPFPGMLEAIDAWWGGHDSDALLRRELEQVNAAAPGGAFHRRGTPRTSIGSTGESPRGLPRQSGEAASPRPRGSGTLDARGRPAHADPRSGGGSGWDAVMSAVKGIPWIAARPC